MSVETKTTYLYDYFAIDFLDYHAAWKLLKDPNFDITAKPGHATVTQLFAIMQCYIYNIYCRGYWTRNSVVANQCLELFAMACERYVASPHVRHAGYIAVHRIPFSSACNSS